MFCSEASSKQEVDLSVHVSAQSTAVHPVLGWAVLCWHCGTVSSSELYSNY